MAGVKRRTKYRKQVEADVLDAFQRPDEGQVIVQIVQSHGSNILEVRNSDGEHAKCILPTKYRKLIWVKRGDFLVVSQGDKDYDTAAGSKGTVKYMVEHILNAASIKQLRKDGLWPEGFAPKPGAAAPAAAPAPAEAVAAGGEAAGGGSDSEDSMAGVQVNSNRRRQYVESSDDSDSSDEE